MAVRLADRLLFQRWASTETAARTPIRLATDPADAELTCNYVERRKRQHPEVATDLANQQRALEVAHNNLIPAAPTSPPATARGNRSPVE